MAFKIANNVVIDNSGNQPLAPTQGFNVVGNLTFTEQLTPSTINHYLGSTFGYFTGVSGNETPQSPVPNLSNQREKFPFASDVNSVDVGGLGVEPPPAPIPSESLRQCISHSSSTNGYTSLGDFAPGLIPPPTPPVFRGSNYVRKFPFATDVDATAVMQDPFTEDGFFNVRSTVGHSSTTTGYITGFVSGPPAGGRFPIGRTYHAKFPFATDTEVQDAGTGTVGACFGEITSSDNGYFHGGDAGPPIVLDPLRGTNVVFSFPFATDYTVVQNGAGKIDSYIGEGAVGAGSSNDGYFMGSDTPPQSTVPKQLIRKFPFASDNFITSIVPGTLNRDTESGSHRSVVSQTDVYIGYGDSDPADPDFVPVTEYDKFPFASETTVTKVGDFSVITGRRASDGMIGGNQV